MVNNSDDEAGKKIYRNDERTVRCPVDGCDKEVLARGLHLHVSRTDGDGHGPQGDVPESIDLDDAETVGAKQVEMEYPEERENESVARMCPYCERPFRGKHGVMIHLGQMAGRKNHPEDAAEQYDPDELPIVKVDENENIIEVVEGDTALPSTERNTGGDVPDVDNDEAEELIASLRDRGLGDEADRAEKLLLDG